MQTNQFITVKQLSEKIQISAYTIRQMVRTGKLPAYRLTGKQYLFDWNEVCEIIKNKKIEN
jgi:excisionase family DNA binding protein